MLAGRSRVRHAYLLLGIVITIHAHADQNFGILIVRQVKYYNFFISILNKFQVKPSFRN